MRHIHTKHGYFSQLLLGLLLLVCALPTSAAITASVSRSDIGANETVELTLRATSNTVSNPDTSVLSEDFEILGTRQSRQVQITNGRTESWRDWIITLLPKREGTLTIPAISLGSDSSQPITITVASSIPIAKGRSIQPVFMEATLDSEQVYTQQQILLTLKIFHSVSLYDDSRLSSLRIPDAIVNQLGDTKKYESIINGVRHGIFELQFVISPQKAGQLVIPSLSFTTSIANNNDPFSGLFPSSGTRFIAQSPEITVNVTPPPADYPGEVWLPAKQLSLTESWSQPLHSVKVGDAVTRTITLEATGLNAAQLPTFTIPSPDGINTYPDQSSTNESATANGITSQRVTAIAMIPTQPGVVELPPVKITWFNTQLKTVEVAEIPSSTLTVEPSAIAPSTALSIPIPAVSNNEQKQEIIADPLSAPAVAMANFWKGLAIIMTVLWLITSFALLVIWRKKQPTGIASETLKKGHVQKNIDEPTAFKALTINCKNNENPEKILASLKQWVRLLLDNPGLLTAQQCAEALQSEPLKLLCAEIDSGIYSGSGNPKAGDELLTTCTSIRKAFKKNTQQSPVLKLYPE